MAKNTKPKCFIAMALGREDTEQLYSKSIRPVLNRCGIRPVIIDRKNNNKDINTEIIKEIMSCDLCIADLTYARPSVYYEAGFALAREREVTHTVRSDHFKRGAPDDLRVHFDLSMKPIIDWRNPTDKQFSRRLESRIRATFLKSWNKEQDKNTTLEAARRSYAELSMIAKQHALLECGLEEIRKCRVTRWYAQPVTVHRANMNMYHSSYRDSLSEFGSNAIIHGYKRSGVTLNMVGVLSRTTLKAYEYSFLHALTDESRLHNDFKLSPHELKKIKTVNITYLIATDRGIRRQTIENQFPRFSYDDDTASFYWTADSHWGVPEVFKSKAVTYRLHILDAPRSVFEFQDRARLVTRATFIP